MESLTSHAIENIRDLCEKKSTVSLQLLEIAPITNVDTKKTAIKLKLSDGTHFMTGFLNDPAQLTETEMVVHDIVSVSDYTVLRKMKEYYLIMKKFRVMQRYGRAIGAPVMVKFTYDDAISNATVQQPATKIAAGAPFASNGTAPRPMLGSTGPSRQSPYLPPKPLQFHELLVRLGQQLSDDVEGIAIRVVRKEGIGQSGKPWRKLTFHMLQPRLRGTDEPLRPAPFISIDGFCSHMTDEEYGAVIPYNFYRIRGGLVDNPDQYTVKGALAKIGINKFTTMVSIPDPVDMNTHTICSPFCNIPLQNLETRITLCGVVYDIGTIETVNISNETKELIRLSIVGPVPHDSVNSGITTVTIWGAWGSDNISRLDIHKPVLLLNGRLTSNKRNQSIEIVADNLVMEDDFLYDGESPWSVDGSGRTVLRHPMPNWVKIEFDRIRAWVAGGMRADDAPADDGSAVTDNNGEEDEVARAQREYEEYQLKMAEEEDRRYEEAQRAMREQDNL